MAEQRYIDFIEGIISRTKDRNLLWRYLDKNKDLYEGMKWTKTTTEFGMFGTKDKTLPDFNCEDSFYTNIGNIYIVLFVWRDRPAQLFVVPDTYKKVTELTPNEYGEHITRLLNLVQSQFPNAETFIDNFLEKENSKKSD